MNIKRKNNNNKENALIINKSNSNQSVCMIGMISSRHHHCESQIDRNRIYT